MVRAHAKQTSHSDKEDFQKKKSSPKKKFAEPGSWPCKINGCDKVFAREADLKRHQRTTKTHTIPGFACPQCDATFTRTDALRRHQKSRHNGVIIEPQEEDNVEKDANGERTASRSSSRSVTPTGSNADPEVTDSSPQVSSSTGTQYSSGHSNYYRPHTMHTSPYTSHSVLMDNYPSPISIPTSAARLAGPPWQPPPGWPDDTPLPHPGMYPPPHYPPSSYYRPPLYPMHPPGYPSMHPEYMASPYPYPGPRGTSFVPPAGIMQPPLSAVPRGSSTGPTKNDEKNAQGEMALIGRGPPSKRRKMSHTSDGAGGETDPNNSPTPRDGAEASNGAQGSLEASLVLDTDEAATVVALLQQASGHPRSPSSSDPLALRKQEGGAVDTPARVRSPTNMSIPADEADADVDADGEADTDVDADTEGDAEIEGVIAIPATPADSKPHTSMAGVQPPLQSPPLDHVLTEDGVAMLNPAELLTFESLASPSHT